MSYAGEYPPKVTPWGTWDHAEQVAPGVFFVGTPSHGGLAVHRDTEHGPAAHSAAAASRFSHTSGPWAFLEEDCDAPRFAAAHGID